jgi:hypothetical protein
MPWVVLELREYPEFSFSGNVRFIGYMERLNTEDAVIDNYEVYIWTRATDFMYDLRFLPLWNFVVGFLTTNVGIDPYRSTSSF